MGSFWAGELLDGEFLGRGLLGRRAFGWGAFGLGVLLRLGSFWLGGFFRELLGGGLFFGELMSIHR